MSPYATGSAAITGAMLGGLVSWACTLVHITPPPTEVAGTIGALILAGAHLLANILTPGISADGKPTSTGIRNGT